MNMVAKILLLMLTVQVELIANMTHKRVLKY